MNPHFNVSTISRNKGQSLTKRATYISGVKLQDGYTGKTHYHKRDDVLYCKVFLPLTAPVKLYDLQTLLYELDRAETNWNARMARDFKGALPNELLKQDWVQIVSNYIQGNFLTSNLCAIAALHDGNNPENPERNNPHVHILVPTRPLDHEGFCRHKDRSHDSRRALLIWREQWAAEQNRAYERNGLDIRVDHRSLKEQGLEREPVPYLHRADWQKEQRGERTEAGERRREIVRRNKEREQNRQMERAREQERDR